MSADKAAFVEHFRAGWAGGRETLIPRFLPDLLDPDVVMTQPLLPPARGHDGFAAFFDVLFGAIPDLRGELHDWRATDDGVEVDFTLHGTLGRAPFALPTTDRIVLRDGRVLERHARMDPRALAATVARHPLASAALVAAPLRAQPPLERALAGLAFGRIALGAPSRLAPRATARAFGAGAAANAEFDYMTRVFGIRAVALGLGWLSTEGAARRRWQRLAFMCDVSDTLAGIGHLRRRDLPRGPALATTALTGTYALVGALCVAADVRAARGCEQPHTRSGALALPSSADNGALAPSGRTHPLRNESSMTLALLVGPVAAASGVFMALSPLLQARRIRTLGDSSEVSAGVFLMMRTNATIWLTYGVAAGNLVIVVPNICALVTTTFTLLTIKRFRHAGHAVTPTEHPRAPLRRHAARVRGGVVRAGVLVRR